MALLGGVGSFLDRFVLGYALGTAAGPSLEPFVQDLANLGWEANPVKPPTIYTTIQGVARGQIPEDQVRTWAHRQGFNDDVVDALLATAEHGPAFGELLEAWRRGLIGDADFDTGLRRLEIESRWWPALKGLKREILSAAEAANARQQGFISDTDQVAIAAEHGLNAADALVQYELAGLPPGIETALEMLRRSIIDTSTFAQIVREGHTKTKYTQQLEQLERRVLQHNDYVQARLRGWINTAAMNAGGALTGYSPADMDLLFKIHGRPLSWHQIFIGLRRGGKYDGDTSALDPAFLKGLEESDIRPEWYNLAWAQRYTYPAAFVLRTLTEAGDITQAESEQILLFEGWEPNLAKTVSSKWAGGTGPTADKHVAKAQTQLWTRTHSSYIAGEISTQAARTALGAAGVPASSIQGVLQVWNDERSLIRAQLTAKQLVKLVSSQAVNPATNAPWTSADVMPRLLELGYDQADAESLLELG